MQEHLDYELVQSTNPEFNKAVVRVNIFRDHRQTIQVKKCMLVTCKYQSLDNFVVSVSHSVIPNYNWLAL